MRKRFRERKSSSKKPKKNAIMNILNMDTVRMIEYGASVNLSEITKITSCAAKVMALKYQLQAYDYFNQKEDAKNE